MSPRLPRITAKAIIIVRLPVKLQPTIPGSNFTNCRSKVLEKDGFALARQSGSHKIYINPVGRRVTVPYHAGKTLHPKLVKSILADAGWATEDLIRYMG